MTRMIERWFPCAEVSAAAAAGWGLGRAEKAIFPWFAARPPAQARAAVLCSLLPWPEDTDEQVRLQKLVCDALLDRFSAWRELRSILETERATSVSVLDPFSGRGMIPLEAARFGLQAAAVDYSPVAVLASNLLANYTFRDWSAETALPFNRHSSSLNDPQERLLDDIETVLRVIGERWTASMQEFYPLVNGKQPWGYIWAVTLPCQECERRFPLVGSYELRKPSTRKGRGGKSDTIDLGQSFYILPDLAAGSISVVVHEGPPIKNPTLLNSVDAQGRKIQGKSAICIFCGHVHGLKVHQRLASAGLGRDMLLIAADLDSDVGKKYRTITDSEHEALEQLERSLAHETEFGPNVAAVPTELIPANNGATIRPQLYGASNYGDLMCVRQTLGFVRLAREIDRVFSEISQSGCSREYAQALTGYAAAQMVRKLKYSTRAASLYVSNQQIVDIFLGEGAIGFSYDFFEAGIGDGPGTWTSLVDSALSTIKTVTAGRTFTGKPADIWRGSVTSLPQRDRSVQAIVTDPPYDAMVYYSDSSDFFFSWLKRAVGSAFPELWLTADPRGVQEKSLEIIVKEHGKAPGEHRNRKHYDESIAAAFAEMGRVVTSSGIVTIVFGSNDPEVWQRLLSAVTAAGLLMTGSWPASTEAGGTQSKANIKTTLTMACRPVPTDRKPGRKGAVEREIRAEIERRYPDWARWGLAPADMLMAAAGPAMEVVGKYSEVLNAKGEPVDIYTFLPLARAAVQAAMAFEVDHYPLETFDARTRFSLWWLRLYGKQAQAKSELRWQTLASSLDVADVRDLIADSEKGVQFVSARAFKARITAESAVIDVALSLAAASEDGMAGMGEVLSLSGRSADDAYLWATLEFLADRLPDSDPDAIAFTRVLRTRDGIANAASAVVSETEKKARTRKDDEDQLRLL